MKNLADFYLRFWNDKGEYYVSLDKYMNSHQDSYQDDHDDFLYEWVDIGGGRGCRYYPIT
jgi:hypothetical protein